MKMLLDTSFIISATKGRLDIVEELRKFGRPSLYVLDLVVKELESFSTGRGKRALDSRMSLRFIEQNGVHVIRTRGGHTDRKIVTYATNRGMAVCTVDRQLKETLLRRGAKVITIRQGKYLVLAMALKRHSSRRG
jgi:rRNA-processing protein FCF1